MYRGYPTYKEYYKDHREQFLKSSEKYRRSEHGHKHRSEWGKKNESRYTKKRAVWGKKSYDKLRKAIIDLLGGKCCNPECLVIGGCTDMRCLQVDHKNGGGLDDRNRFNKSNMTMYRYYLNNPDEAKEKLQILCANCNRIKAVVRLERIKRCLLDK